MNFTAAKSLAKMAWIMLLTGEQRRVNSLELARPTPEQRTVLGFMDQMGMQELVFRIAHWPDGVTITRNDVLASKPLAEILAVKIRLYESGDLSHFRPTK